ncbi:MAG: FHA domain-containing protein, partial [Planctomycetia bacterium]
MPADQLYPVLHHPASDRRFSLSRERPFLAGRRADADLPLDDPACSRNHFTVRYVDGRWLIESANKDNPATLDGRPVLAAAALRQ